MCPFKAFDLLFHRHTRAHLICAGCNVEKSGSKSSYIVLCAQLH